MNENTRNPRYFRLLEKEETIKEGDQVCNLGGKLQDSVLAGYSVRENTLLRPVQVDEWQSYAERKPTKEDFEPTGLVQYYFSDNEVRNFNLTCPPSNDVLFWRRISPPQPAKPKEVDLVLEMNNTTQPMTLRADGTVKLKCGSEISAESIKEFMTAYQEVTGTKPH